MAFEIFTILGENEDDTLVNMRLLGFSFGRLMDLIYACYRIVYDWVSWKLTIMMTRCCVE